MNAPELNKGFIEDIKTALKSMELPHTCDEDVMSYPGEVKGLLLRDGYIDYDITEDGIKYRWVPGVLDLLSDKPDKKPETGLVTDKLSITDIYNSELHLTARTGKKDDTLKISAQAVLNNEVHTFSDYSLVLKKLTDTMADGVYGLYAEIPGRPETIKPICVFTCTNAQLGLEDAKICWKKTGVHEFSCEALGFTISLDDSIEVNGCTALRVVLDHNSAYAADDGITLMTVRTETFGRAYTAHAAYLRSTCDPLMSAHYETRVN